MSLVVTVIFALMMMMMTMNQLTMFCHVCSTFTDLHYLFVFLFFVLLLH